MLPFVMMTRPLQESNVVGKGGTAGFLGAAHDPYYFYQDPAKGVNLDDLTLRKDVSTERLQRRESLLKSVNDAMPAMEKAVEKYALDAYYQKAFDLDPSNRGAFTALERVCYRREDWSEALRMYDAALRLVEQQRSRAYRLGDLYARRGQVLLQYLNRPTDAAACSRGAR